MPIMCRCKYLEEVLLELVLIGIDVALEFFPDRSKFGKGVKGLIEISLWRVFQVRSVWSRKCQWEVSHDI